MYLILVWFKNWYKQCQSKLFHLTVSLNIFIIRSNMKLILILYKNIQQAILYKPLRIQNFTPIFQYQISFQYYSSYWTVNWIPPPPTNIHMRPHAYEIWDPPLPSLYFANEDCPQCSKFQDKIFVSVKFCILRCLLF